MSGGQTQTNTWKIMENHMENQKLPGRSCVSTGSSPESSSLLRLLPGLPSQICHRTGTSQRPTAGMFSVLLFFVAKGSILLLTITFKCQCPENHPTQYFNQFQSSFKRAFSPLERSSVKKSPKDRLFYL